MAVETVAITDTTDDGTEDSVFGFDVSFLNCGRIDFSPSEATAFLRFGAINIATTPIISATLTLNVTEIVGTPDTTWFGIDADNANRFSDPVNLPSEATTTTASVDGDPAGTGLRTFDFTAIVQEILNRAGWESGNALAFVCKNNAESGDAYWLAEDLGGDGVSPPSISIEIETVPTIWRRMASARLGGRRRG